MSRLRLLSTAALAAALVASAASAAQAASGSFSALSYNVAGLPEPLSSGSPARNTRTIGERTMGFDVVSVQEDFNYHAALYATARHPFRTPTSGGVPFGSGLNTMSTLPLSAPRRTTWRRCFLEDCLTPKGFTQMRLTLAPGVEIDLYNAHMNAQTSLGALRARRSNVDQLAEAIRARSAGRAVLVMADTNTRYTRSADNIRHLTADGLGLTDAWVQSQRGGTPPPQGSPALTCELAETRQDCETVDKILFRSGGGISLTLNGFTRESTDFFDAAGRPLSDHAPVSARFSWETDGAG